MSDAEAAAPAPVSLPVDGMSCQSCVDRIDLAIGELDGIDRVDVRRGDGQIDLWPTPAVEVTAVRRAATARLAELGYAPADAGDDERGRRMLVMVAALAAVVVAAGYLLFTRVQGAYLDGGVIADPWQLFGTASIAALAVAFGLGLVVGFSPVTLAAAPVAMGYATREAHRGRRRPLQLTAAFAAGMVAISLLLGGVFALVGTPAIDFFSSRLAIWYALMALVLTLLAIVLTGVWRPRTPWAARRVPQGGRAGAGGAFLAGLPFGILVCPGCTPLLFPVLMGAIATGSPAAGAALLGSFALGQTVPLLAAGASTGALTASRSMQRYIPVIERTVGTLLLAAAAYFAGRAITTWATIGLG